MTPFGSFGKTFSILAVVLSAISAFAQSPPKYDPATETKLKGTVEELKFVPPTGAKTVA